MLKDNKSQTNKRGSNPINSSVAVNPITSDATLLSYFKNPSKYNEVEIFDKSYAQALELMCGDKLLKPASTINSVTIRKTTTRGLYKLIINGHESGIQIEHIDEGKLLNNRKYCSGTVSRIGENEYEVTYFDFDDEITIERYSKEELIDFMSKNKLIFQV